MEGSICRLDVSHVNGDWKESIALDIYGASMHQVKAFQTKWLEDGDEITRICILSSTLGH